MQEAKSLISHPNLPPCKSASSHLLSPLPTTCKVLEKRLGNTLREITAVYHRQKDADSPAAHTRPINSPILHHSVINKPAPHKKALNYMHFISI